MKRKVLMEEVKRLQQALAFYADATNYRHPSPFYMPTIELDQGKRARDALAPRPSTPRRPYVRPQCVEHGRVDESFRNFFRFLLANAPIVTLRPLGRTRRRKHPFRLNRLSARIGRVADWLLCRLFGVRT